MPDIAKAVEEHHNLPDFIKVLPDGRWVFHVDDSVLSHFARCEMLFREQHMPDAAGKVLRSKGGVSFTVAHGGWWSDCLSNLYESIAAKRMNTLETFLLDSAICWLVNDMDRFANSSSKKQYEDWCGGMAGKFTLTKPIHIITKDGKELSNITEIRLPVGAKDMLTQYYRQYADKDNRDFIILATESGFGLRNELLLIEDDYVVVYLTGRPDMVVYEVRTGKIPTIDHKVTDEINDTTRNKWKPHFQFIGYCLAADAIIKRAGHDAHTHDFIVNLAARKEPTDKPRNGGAVKPRFERVRLTFAESEIAEYKASTLKRVRRMRSAIETDNYEFNDVQCTNGWMICEYRDLHSIPLEKRALIQQGNYTRIDPWKPYTVRVEEE